MNIINAIALVAEKKIEEALREGAFDDLPGRGKPLELEDLSHMPGYMRMAYTILKSSGFIEKQTETRCMVCLGDLLDSVRERGEDGGKARRFTVMMTRVQRAKEKESPGDRKKGSLPRLMEPGYLKKMLDRL